jgi:hypothetical protein
VYETRKSEASLPRPEEGYVLNGVIISYHTVSTTLYTPSTANLHSHSTLVAPLTSRRSSQSQDWKIHRTQVVHGHGEPTFPSLLRSVMRVCTLAQSLKRYPDSSQRLGSDTVRLVPVSQVKNTLVRQLTVTLMSSSIAQDCSFPGSPRVRSKYEMARPSSMVSISVTFPLLSTSSLPPTTRPL